MSNELQAIALIDDAIAKMTAARNDMQERHNALFASLHEAKKQTVAYECDQIIKAFGAAAARALSSIERWTGRVGR